MSGPVVTCEGSAGTFDVFLQQLSFFYQDLHQMREFS
jgi:hypothetical protein